MTDLIDTTEMYLRTILELEEEGIPRCAPASSSDWSTPAPPSPRPWPAWSGTGWCTWAWTAGWS